MMAIEVEDSGPGIRMEEIDHIFEPFLRGSAAQGIGGTGLGLTISKMLTELMGGELGVTSRLGQGTTFQVRLFLPQARVEYDIESVSMQWPTGYKGPRRRVLVVDNEPVDRELLINILQPLGFEVAEAATGRECLQIYPEFKPDIILMDLAMPVMDGWEASYVIRKIHESNVHIGIVSANAFDKGMENTADITAADFIVKPVNVQDLLRWLGERLGIEWITADEIPQATSDYRIGGEGFVVPPEAQLNELLAVVQLGYIRGITKKLDEILAMDSRHENFVMVLKKMAQQFQMEAMRILIKEARGHD
jgi:CheY-like chemotaxis protein